MDRMRWGRRAVSLLAIVAGAVALSAAGAVAAGHFKSCGDRPNRLQWNLVTRGTSCEIARKVSYHGASGKTTKVKAHLFHFETKTGWSCLYTVFHSNKAQDSEGEIFDCRKGTAVIRWTDSPDIQPRSLH